MQTPRSGPISTAPPPWLPWTRRSRVEWSDTDAAGIHHNSLVGRLVEAAEASMMRELGLVGYFAAAPRVRYEVVFESPLRFGQEVTTLIEVQGIGTSSMTFGFEVWGEKFEHRSRRRSAHGQLVTVHVPGGHHDGLASSSPWPASWVQSLETLRL